MPDPSATTTVSTAGPLPPPGPPPGPGDGRESDVKRYQRALNEQGERLVEIHRKLSDREVEVIGLREELAKRDAESRKRDAQVSRLKAALAAWRTPAAQPHAEPTCDLRVIVEQLSDLIAICEMMPEFDVSDVDAYTALEIARGALKTLSGQPHAAEAERERRLVETGRELERSLHLWGMSSSSLAKFSAALAAYPAPEPAPAEDQT